MMTKSPCRRRLTHISQAARVVPAAPETVAMLRDIAYVLHLTGKVKNQMMAVSESNPSSLALAASDDGF
jgi:hypothetical protein